MLFQFIAYLKFLYHSKNEHGVHSPFVFDLVTKCFYDKRYKPEYTVLKRYRNDLLTNQNHIMVTDLGCGSKIFKSNRRQIAQIAQTAGISKKRAQLLYRISRYFSPNSMLEIGTSLGLASSALAVGAPNAYLLSLEGCKNTLTVAEQAFNTHFSGINYAFLNAEFGTFLKSDAKNSSWDLIYFDGNHSKKATLAYFNLLLPTATNTTVWIFDDIHWSAEMTAAWKSIKNHPKVTVTIDTFQWGLVFFRTEQAKQNFVIRV